MKRRKQLAHLTPLELEIMKVLWESGPATVQRVQENLPGERRLAYTTVQTMLNVLHRKGKVRRSLKSRAYEYEPAVTRQRAVRQALRDMIDRMFGGSPESLVMSLIESRHLTAAKLDRLSKLLKDSEAADAAKEARRGND